MTTYGISSLRKLVGVVESAWGTTPATPSLVDIPYTSLKLNPLLDTYDDTSIYGDRMQRFSVGGNEHITGELDLELAPSIYDNFLASVMNASWTSNVLKVSSAPVTTSMTLQEIQEDLNIYTTFTGVVVDKLSVTVPASGLVTAKLSLIGKGFSDAATTQPLTGATVSSAAVAVPFVHNTGTFTLNGASAPDITSLTFVIDNKMTANFTLGFTTAQAITLGDANVSGSFTVLFDSIAERDLFVANAYTSLSATLTSTVGGVSKSLTFNFPNIVLKSSDRTSAKNGVISETYAFVAVYDPSTGSNVVITRT